MTEQAIRFDDGAAYEQMMGVWSRSAGRTFLDWLAPPPGLRWIDVGCGNGAFTELLVERCAPAEVQGIDPSEGQLAYARARPGVRLAEFRQGDAMALPFPDGKFDAAVMALVIVFVPEPAKGVAEMVRVVKPGGIVATYMWDMPGGGFPGHPVAEEMRAIGVKSISPPQMGASRMDAMRDLWTNAGLESVETREITVQRTYASFDALWTIALTGFSQTIAKMVPADVETLRQRVRVRLPADTEGRITYGSRAHAIKGRRPR
jgi:ubiquinone/menaquinone biosynthesis C-methylase UbiE